jgi:hypothetical protein
MVPLTVKTLVLAFHESSPRVVVPAIDLQVYDDDGVRFTAAVGVALLLIASSATPLAVSNFGGVPDEVVHGDFGPRSEFRYHHPISLTVGGDVTGGAGRIDPAYGAQHVSFGTYARIPAGIVLLCAVA